MTTWIGKNIAIESTSCLRVHDQEGWFGIYLVQFICKYLRYLKVGITEQVKTKEVSPKTQGKHKADKLEQG